MNVAHGWGYGKMLFSLDLRSCECSPWMGVFEDHLGHCTGRILDGLDKIVNFLMHWYVPTPNWGCWASKICEWTPLPPLSSGLGGRALSAKDQIKMISNKMQKYQLSLFNCYSELKLTTANSHVYH